MSITLSAVFAASPSSPINGTTPTALRPAEIKSPLAMSTGIDAKFVTISIPGINDAAVKKSLRASRKLPLVFPKSPDRLYHPAFFMK